MIADILTGVIRIKMVVDIAAADREVITNPAIEIRFGN